MIFHPISILLKRKVFYLLSFFVPCITLAQETLVRGKVTDAANGNPIPYANIIFAGSSIGVTTDFEGLYELKTDLPVDTIIVSYIGYQSRKRVVVAGIEQVIHIQLEEDITRLQELTFYAGENPAFDVLRKVVRNKSKNDKRRLLAYEYDTYTKIEIDVDNMSDKFRERKLIKKITKVLDSVERIAGDDGKPVLPIFISESISKFYYRDNPQLRLERIEGSKINGIGIEDGTLVTQLIGSTFQEYNFYQNWLNIVTKEFVSPIADGWRLYYEYDLTDSLYVEDKFCYRLDFFPKSPQDLAFTGTMWITKDEYALKQIDVTVGRQANLNFIEKIKIQQELEQTQDGAWLPSKNRILVDVGEITKNAAGMLAKFYNSNKDFVINKPYSPSFYTSTIVMNEDARKVQENEAFWDSVRHEPLSSTEKNVIKMIDTLQKIPVVKTYTEIGKIVINGYYYAGKVKIGPYISMLSYNNIEGIRIQGGFKTTIDFSNKWVFGAQAGYGFNDHKPKYNLSAQHILSRDKWTTLTFRYRKDLGRVGIDEELLADNFLILAAQRWGTIRRGYYFDEYYANLRSQVFKGFALRTAFRYMTFDPTFNFGYYDPNDLASGPVSSFETAEVIAEARYAKDELFLYDDNDRISLGTTHWPEITLRYTRGIRGLAGSDFDYHKLRLSFYKRIRFGPLGIGYLNLMGEYIFNPIPYPLLAPHLGNQTPLYTTVTYNTMDYGEFVSDQYASMMYQHHFEGFLLNRIPLMNKLKWRLVGTANILYGGMSEMNKALLPDDQSDDFYQVGYLDPGRPFVELGYGVENIFRFFRVDFVHRLTYTGENYQARNPDVRKFMVLFSAQFTL